MSIFSHTNRESQGRTSTDGYSRMDSPGHAILEPANSHLNAQREMLNQSPKAHSQIQLRQMLNGSPRVVAQAKLAQAMNSRDGSRQGQQPIQRQEAMEDEELTQRQAALEEEELLQGKFAPLQREETREDEEPLQSKSETAQRRENQTGLPDNLKAGVENLSGLSLDDVRVHYNSAAPATVQALAYTQGTEIHVGLGQEQHLAHEAWHVAQQKQGRVQPTTQAKGVAINDDKGLEAEADAMGDRAQKAGNSHAPSNASANAPAAAQATAQNTTQLHLVAQPGTSGGGLAGEPVVQRAIKIGANEWYTDPLDIAAALPQVLHPELIRKLQSLGQDGLTHAFASWQEAIAYAQEMPDLALEVEPEREAEPEILSLHNEEADVAAETTPFYHGTDLATAQKLAGGVKIDARGKGELGGGFYMTHDMYQAAHIGDYYTGKEERGPSWGVVQFDIPSVALQSALKNKKVIYPKDFEAYYNKVKEQGNKKESSYSWTIGPIKDKKTPYIQHLFASSGLAALNDKATTRTLVLSGAVGIEKAKYSNQVRGYDQDEDEVLDELIEREPDEEVSSDEDSSSAAASVDYDTLESRVNAALKAKNKNLTRNVIEELEEALEIVPEDERITAWLESLQ